MSNYNKVILMGNLTRDVELRHTQGGTALAKFGMAINRRWTVDGETKESVCFVDLTAWGKQAEILAEHTRKGMPLFIEGRLEYSSWDGDDGKKKSKLDVVVENFQFVSGRASDASAPRRERASKAAETLRDREQRQDEDVPF